VHIHQFRDPLQYLYQKWYICRFWLANERRRGRGEFQIIESKRYSWKSKYEEEWERWFYLCRESLRGWLHQNKNSGQRGIKALKAKGDFENAIIIRCIWGSGWWRSSTWTYT
jgi:hypothetical protein